MEPFGPSSVPRGVDWYMGGKIEIDPMITNKLRFEDINHCYELMYQGELIRTVADFKQ